MTRAALSGGAKEMLANPRQEFEGDILRAPPNAFYQILKLGHQRYEGIASYTVVKMDRWTGSSSHFGGAPICNRLESLENTDVSRGFPPKAGCKPALRGQNENCWWTGQADARIREHSVCGPLRAEAGVRTPVAKDAEEQALDALLSSRTMIDPATIID